MVGLELGTECVALTEPWAIIMKTNFLMSCLDICTWHLLQATELSNKSILSTMCSIDTIYKNKSCVMNTTAGYVIMYIQNDVMMFKNVI